MSGVRRRAHSSALCTRQHRTVSGGRRAAVSDRADLRPAARGLHTGRRHAGGARHHRRSSVPLFDARGSIHRHFRSVDVWRVGSLRTFRCATRQAGRVALHAEDFAVLVGRRRVPPPAAGGLLGPGSERRQRRAYRLPPRRDHRGRHRRLVTGTLVHPDRHRGVPSRTTRQRQGLALPDLDWFTAAPMRQERGSIWTTYGLEEKRTSTPRPHSRARRSAVATRSR